MHTAMLRYFYLLLFFLLAIKWTLCYEYISDHKFGHKHEKPLSGKDKSQNQRSRVEKTLVNNKKHRHSKLIEDKNPTAQIDIASFIQKPDEYALEDNFVYETEAKKSKKTQNYNDYSSLSGYNVEENNIKRNNKRPYSNLDEDKQLDLGVNSFSLKDTINPRQLNLDSLSFHGLNNERNDRRRKATTSDYQRELYDIRDPNIVHKPEKKCILKHMMKLPFFSHNKTDAQKLKKEKKRRNLCFKCSKKEKEKSKNISMGDQVTKEGVTKENLRTPTRVTEKDPDENFDELEPKKREKRNEWRGDSQRQLQELEEIQKKVDSVEILQPFQKMPDATT